MSYDYSDVPPGQRAAIEDYDSGASWDRLGAAYERYGVDAVMADPSLVEPMPEQAVVVYTIGQPGPHVDRNTSPADRLRVAAQRLRDTADKATPGADPYPGGWSGFGHVEGGLHRSAMYAGPAEDGCRTGTVVEVKEDCDCGCIPMTDGDARYIGLFPPAVGRALADWLESEAQLYAPNMAAFAVADQILGIPADVALAEHLAAEGAAVAP